MSDADDDARRDWYAQHCANCKRAWGDVRECCTIQTSPERVTHCTACCDGALHGVDRSDTDESISDVWHG